MQTLRQLLNKYIHRNLVFLNQEHSKKFCNGLLRMQTIKGIALHPSMQKQVIHKCSQNCYLHSFTLFVL